MSSLLFIGTLSASPVFASETGAQNSEVVETPATDTPAEVTVDGTVEDDASAEDEPAEPAPVDNAVDPAPQPPKIVSSEDADIPVDANGTTSRVTLTGEIVTTSHGVDSSHGAEVPEDRAKTIFKVLGFDYVILDFTAVDEKLVTSGLVTAYVNVPASLNLGTTPGSKFAAIAGLSLKSALRVISVDEDNRSHRAMVNQTHAMAAVHKIYAVLVTPSNYAPVGPAANQTLAKVRSAVTHTSNFWTAQSSNAVSFSLVGAVSHYKSTYSCASFSTGATGLWNEAAAKARASLGYAATANEHLVLFFPSNTSCGGATGLAQIGGSVNTGGSSWVIGTDRPEEMSTLSHELGHNLSFGHANWADCSGANPAPGSSGKSGCTINDYGDIYDVMGFGVDGFTGGSLSSPQAIRAGIWPGSAYAEAPAGASSHTLVDVGSYSGKRAVVVEDNLGVHYFVEFRNYAGAHDSQYNGTGCNTDFCMPSGPSVRVLRLEQLSYSVDGGSYMQFDGLPGEDSFVIGRNVAGVKRTGYTSGESYSADGITIAVSSISPTSATVSVTRAAQSFSGGAVAIVAQSNSWPWKVGESLSAHATSSWRNANFTYIWKRNNVPIADATSKTYVLTAADLNTSIKVELTGTNGASSFTAVDPPAQYTGYGPIAQANLVRGTVTAVGSGAGLVAMMSDWTSGTTFKYQWYRGTAAIAGATSVSYTVGVGDNGAALKVRVVGAKAGYAAAPFIDSPPVTLTTAAVDVPTISGTLAPGNVLTSSGPTFTANGVTVAEPATRTYQWYRSGLAIAGATSPTLVLGSVDFGKLITVAVTGRQAGFPPVTTKSAASSITAPGVIAITAAVPVVTKAGLVLTAALPAGALTESGTVTAWKWTRDGAAIAGAIKATYTLTSADYGKQIVAIATITKLAYTTVVRSSASANHSVLASAAPTVSGTPQVGLVLSSSTPTYSTTPVAGAATVTRQWYRSGVAIAGATAASYTLVAADYVKVITVRVVGSVPTFLPAVGTSVATTSVAKGVIAGTKTSATVTKNAAGTVLTAAATPGAITESGVAIAYQWYRNGVAISKATKSTFAVTSADRSKTLHVRLIVTKLNYTSVVLYSTALSYTLVPSVPASIAGTVRVGETLTASAPTYSTFAGPIVATTAYQWYRSGVAIKGATAVAYKLTAADLSKVITVRLIGSTTGYLAWVGTSPASAKVAAGLIAGPNVAPVVTRTAMVLKITTVGSVSEPGVAYGYQWYRNGVAIAKATKTSFTLTSLDAGKLIHVRQLASKTAYTSVSLLSTPVIYSVQRTAAPVIVGTAQVEQPLSVATGTYFTHDLAVVPNAEKFQWYRSGVAIAGATTAAYLVVPADLAKVITVRVSNSAAGYLPYVVTSVATGKVVAGDIGGIVSPPTVSKDSTTLILTANLPAGSIAQSVGVKAVYQWYRAGVAIPKATAATYKLAVADFNKEVKVQVTVTRTAYTTVKLTSDPVNYSVVPSSAAPVIAGNVAIGQPLSIAARTYTNGGVATYQWLRTGVAIAGATNATYTPVAADKGKALSVRVVASTPGFLVSTSTSAATQLIADNYLAGGDSITPVEIDAVGLVITTVATGVTDASATKSYQWYRSGVAIAKATGVSYTAVAADFGKLISVRVIHTKPLHTTVVKWSNGYNASISAVGKPVLSTTSAKRGVPLTVSTPTFTAPSGATVVVSYQWYRSGKAIAGATSATYKPVTADKAKVLTARVVGSVSGLYLPSIQMSAPSKKLA